MPRGRSFPAAGLVGAEGEVARCACALTGLWLSWRGAASHGACLMMTPRPMHRWKSFWLGVIVVVFLGWAWVRSVQHRDAVTFYFPNAGHELTLASRAGAFRLAWNELPPSGVTWPAFTTSSRPTTAQWFADAADIFNGSSVRGVGMSYWLGILLFLGLWLELLFWRVRRRRRAGS